jgi:hypothetical protein
MKKIQKKRKKGGWTGRFPPNFRKAKEGEGREKTPCRKSPESVDDTHTKMVKGKGGGGYRKIPEPTPPCPLRLLPSPPHPSQSSSPKLSSTQASHDPPSKGTPPPLGPLASRVGGRGVPSVLYIRYPPCVA